MGFVEVEFVVVHVLTNAHVLTKSTSPVETGSTLPALVGLRSSSLRSGMP